MNGEENRTLYVGNLDSDVTEELLYELFLQAGPVQYVKIPFDRSTKIAKNFGFVCFKNEESVPYGYYLLDKVQLFGKYLNVQPRNRDKEIPAVENVGIHTLEPQENNKNNKYSNFSNDLAPRVNPYENNAMVVAQNFAGNIHQVNQAGFPVASQANNSLLGYPPFASPPALNALLFPAGFGVPAVDTNYMNSFKNKHDNYNQSNSNRYQNNGHKDNNDRNYYSNRHDSGYNNSSNRGRHGYEESDDKSRLNERLEFSNNSKNYDQQQNDRFDRNHGSGQNYRGSYNNKEYGGGGGHNRSSYDDREYRGGHNRRDSYNNSSRTNYNNRSDGSSSGRYHNSYNNQDDGSSSSRYNNSGGRQNNYQSRY